MTFGKPWSKVADKAAYSMESKECVQFFLL